MSQLQKTQSRANHGRIDPAFHYFAIPALLVVFIAFLLQLVRHANVENGFLLLFAGATIVIALKTRLNAVKVQDRVIRLEERMRLQALCPELSREQVLQFTVPQLIALRFASDGELPGLAQTTLMGSLGPKQIKEQVQNWRGDYLRV